MLAILTGYGVLVLLDTPVHVAADRLQSAGSRLVPRRRPVDLEPDGPDAYDSPLVTDDGYDGDVDDVEDRRRRRRAAGTAPGQAPPPRHG